MSRQQAMQNFQRAQGQAVEQRRILEERRAEADKAKGQLLEQEKKIPLPTQRAMRFGGFAGLAGRKQRQVATKVKGEIGERKRQVSLFKQELRDFEEKELVPFEREVKRFKDMWGF
jgi:hypothetical protein